MDRAAQEEYGVREVIKAVTQEECPFGYKIKLDDKKIERFWESVQVGPIQYGPIPLPRRKLVSKLEERFRNGTDEKQTMTFSKSVTNTATLTWTVNSGFKLGTKVAVEAGLPCIAEGKVDVSPEISLGTTRTQTNTSTQTYSVDLPLTVPPRKCVTADLCVTEASYEADFTVDVAVSASYTFSFNAKSLAGGRVGGKLGGLLGDGGAKETKKVIFTAEDVFKRLPGFWKDEAKGLVYCQVRGGFKGVHGVCVEVVANQEDL